MHLSNPARAVLLFVSAASASAYTCFDADGGNLKTAVGQYIEGTWGDGGEYGPIEEWGGVPKIGRNTFNANITAWDTSKVTSMKSMFRGASAFNQDLSAWDTSSVTRMGSVFYHAISFNQDISGWNITSDTNMYQMFLGASAFNQNLCDWRFKNFPYDNAEHIFLDSGCLFKTNPVESDQGPFCAASAAECTAATAPSNSQTNSSSHAPSPGPTNQPTPLPSPAPTNSPTNLPTPTPAIRSWALAFSSFSSNFTKGSESEVTINYEIGQAAPTESVFFLDAKKDAIAKSNIWNSTTKTVELCVKVELTSDGSGEVIVIKKLERDVGIELLFNTEFETIDEAKFGKISLESEEDNAQVGNYIKACISLADEMEISYLDRLKMTQEDDINSNSNELVIVQARDLVDDTISSMSYVRPKNGVHVATVIPASFFSYNGDQWCCVPQASRKSSPPCCRDCWTAQSASTDSTTYARALRAETESTGGADKESAFAIEVKLEKNELGLGDADVTTAANSAAVMSGVFGSAAVIMMW
ncbi:DUF285 domain-containing protein [Skeletonema marinoi]|uniref:DUF285 domain-containing protein n=1 Tax=Skeletonema marinoi TaxID=267567 RepID=A0AAD8Y8B0_9STRA|nr:DUF285 domain-containing protein [Skeletonema marinoi]